MDEFKDRPVKRFSDLDASTAALTKRVRGVDLDGGVGMGRNGA